MGCLCLYTLVYVTLKGHAFSRVAPYNDFSSEVYEPTSPPPQNEAHVQRRVRIPSWVLQPPPGRPLTFNRQPSARVAPSPYEEEPSSPLPPPSERSQNDNIESLYPDVINPDQQYVDDEEGFNDSNPITAPRSNLFHNPIHDRRSPFNSEIGYDEVVSMPGSDDDSDDVISVGSGISDTRF